MQRKLIELMFSSAGSLSAHWVIRQFGSLQLHGQSMQKFENTSNMPSGFYSYILEWLIELIIITSEYHNNI